MQFSTNNQTRNMEWGAKFMDIVQEREHENINMKYIKLKSKIINPVLFDFVDSGTKKIGKCDCNIHTCIYSCWCRWYFYLKVTRVSRLLVYTFFFYKKKVYKKMRLKSSKS